MEAARFDQIEVFVTRFKGPASRVSEAYRMECFTEAMDLLSETNGLSPEQASDYHPQISLLLWLADTIEVISADGGGEATTIHPALVPKPFGAVRSGRREIEDVVFDRLSNRYPVLTSELERRLSFLKSSQSRQSAS